MYIVLRIRTHEPSSVLRERNHKLLAVVIIKYKAQTISDFHVVLRDRAAIAVCVSLVVEHPVTDNATPAVLP